MDIADINMKLPSTTQVISFCNQGAFANVSPERMEIASLRGSAFHELAAAYALGLPILEVPEGVAGFFASFKKWFSEMVLETVMVEEQLTDKVREFTGTPDAILRLKGDSGLTLLDWKSPITFSKSWIIQCCTYRELAEMNGYKIDRIATLQPRRDGKRAKFTEFTRHSKVGFSVFLSALNVWKFFNEG